MLSKSKSWILIGVLLAACIIPAAAQIATTTVADTIYHADGTPATGTAIFSWPAFTTSNGDTIPSGSTSAVIAAGGALSVQLIPNTGATPIGSYYTVVYHLDDGSVTRQYWMVPASAAPVTVSAVESTVLPTSVAMQTASRSYVDTAIAAAVSGHPLDSSPYLLKAGDTMTGPLLLPADPVSAAQAADKHYVDASVAAATAGIAQNSSAPMGTEYMVPAYLQSPSGGMASPAPTHLSVDPTGYTLNGYHAGFTDLGINSADADCTQIGGLFGGHSCVGFNVTYTNDAPGIEWGNVLNYTAYGPGQNLGNNGRARQNTPWSVNDVNLARGGNAANSLSMFGSRVGDWGPWYVYDFSAGGTQAPSDEGITVAGTYEGGESYGYGHYTIATGGAGSTTPTFATGGGCGAMNLCTPVDGGILLDTQSAAASGSLTGPSVNVSTGAVPLQALPVSTMLPLTTAWGHAEGISIPAQQERNAPAPATVALTMVMGSFTPGDHVCVEGTATTGGFDEQSTITSVSGGTVTLPLAYPYTNIAIFKGGPCGTYISFSANLALAGYRTTYHAIASFTGSDLVYAVPSGVGLNQQIGSGLPQAGVEPETTGGPSDPNAAFQTFCGAEIVANLSTGATPQIDPNVCAWAPGDTVESPHFPMQKVFGETMIVNQNMPNNDGGTGGININLRGMGVASFVQGYQVLNNNDDSWYTSGGGKLLPPQCAFCTGGTWNDGLLMSEAPAHTILETQNHLPGQTSYNIFQDPSWGTEQIAPSGFTFTSSIATPGSVSAAGFFATANLDTRTAGDGAEISVVDGALRNTTPSLTQAGLAGTNFAMGEVGFGTTTPIAPILNIVTADNFPASAQGWYLVSNAGGTATPVIFGQSNQYASDANLTLENGTTHCATLICLGPGLAINSGGGITLAGAPAGSYLKADGTGYGTPGSGGGGSGIAGSGSTGAIPAWTGSAALGNSHLDDGATAPGVLTATEQFDDVTSSASGGQLFDLLAPGMTGGAVSMGIGKSLSADNSVFLAWWSNQFGSFETYGNTAPIAIRGTNVVLSGPTAVNGNGSNNTLGTTCAAGISLCVLDGTTHVVASVSTSGTINAPLYQGPANAPTGACAVVGWAFSQDGHATFCNGAVWVPKI